MGIKLPSSVWALLGSLYITQYLGLGFFLVALVAILRSAGVSLEQLGIIYLLGIVWALKLFWAPLVDRFGIDCIGHFRGWLIAMQSGMVLSLLAIAWLDPVADFVPVFLLCLLFAFFSATQDIAVDGLACRLLGTEERGIGNGLRNAGNLLGNLLGGGVVLMVYPYLGWRIATLFLAAGTAVSLVQLLFFREPEHCMHCRPKVRLFHRFRHIWHNSGGGQWLLILAFYPVGVSLSYALITPILVDAGWSLDRIGFVFNVIGNMLGILTALATGYLIRRYGRLPVMRGAALLQIPGIVALVLPVRGETGEFAVAVAVSLYFLCYSPVVTVITTLIMDHASQDSPATDFSLQYSVYMLFGILAASLSAALASTFGYMAVLGLAACCGAVMVFLSFLYRGLSSVAKEFGSEKNDGSGLCFDSRNE